MNETERAEWRKIENRYRRALRFARACSTLQQDGAEAELAALRFERRTFLSKVRRGAMTPEELREKA